MSLRSAMDGYREAALDAVGGKAAPPRARWFGAGRDWRPDVRDVERAVGFEVGEVARTLWDHELSRSGESLLPGVIFVHGPIALFLGPPLLRFGYLHFGVEKQIPLLNFAPDFSYQTAVVSSADPEGDVWVAGAMLDQEVSHPLQLSVTELFELWTVALAEGDLVAVDGRIEVSGERGVASVEDLTGRARLDYSLFPGDAEGKQEVALAAGGVLDEAHDFEEWFGEIESVSRDRVSSWEASHGPLPFNELLDALARGYF